MRFRKWKRLQQVATFVTTLAVALSVALAPLPDEAAAFLPVRNSISAQAAGPVQGIDVSAYQGAVNWQAVKASGIQFAFVRIGTSKTIDRFYPANLNGAAAVGIRAGAYWYTYAASVDQARAEAQLMVSLMQNYPVSFPVAIDIEAEIHKGLPPDQLAAIANTFCDVIAAAGYYPMVYASRNWFVQRIGAVYADKWVAQYNTVNTHPGPYTVWQYTSNGAVGGIAGRVDMNYLFKDYASVIPPEGFTDVGGKRVFYSNYRKKAGWITYNNGLYYAAPDFTITTGWFNDGSAMRYLDPLQGGKAAVGFYKIDKGSYLFDANGVQTVGLQPVGSQFMYFNPASGGAAASGFVTLPDGTRYFGPDYAMVSGMQQIQGKTYDFNASGILQYGLQNTPVGMMYFDPASGGAAATGMTATPEGMRYFDENHIMKTGLQTVGKKLYYFNEKGIMANTGLTALPDGLYYFGADGAAVSGMVTAADGKIYFMGGDYKAQIGLIQTPGGTYYTDVDGHLVTGFLQTSAGYYYFDPATGLMVRNATVNIAGMNCTFDANGILIAPQGLTPQVSAVAPGTVIPPKAAAAQPHTRRSTKKKR